MVGFGLVGPHRRTAVVKFNFLSISVDHKPLPVSPLSLVGVLSDRYECEIYLVGYLAVTFGEHIFIRAILQLGAELITTKTTRKAL
ncbi:hypothetical protein SDJN03_27635, partial [Cucurbita argyrosperma subsp. sororia]